MNTLAKELFRNWHYRKLYALRALDERIKFEMPIELTPDQIATISRERRDVIASLNKEWETVLSLNWNQFSSHH